MTRNTRTHPTTNPSTITLPHNTGTPRVSELHRVKQRFEEKIETTHTPSTPNVTGPCWEWTAGTRNGYGQIWVQGQAHSAHRVAYQLYRGEIPDNTPCIHHECRNTTCVNPDHLTPVTAQENSRRAWVDGDLETPTRDEAVKGGQNRAGENAIHPSTAVEIREEYETRDVSYADLADKYSTSTRTIGRIIRGERACDQPLPHPDTTGNDNNNDNNDDNNDNNDDNNDNNDDDTGGESTEHPIDGETYGSILFLEATHIAVYNTPGENDTEA